MPRDGLHFHLEVPVLGLSDESGLGSHLLGRHLQLDSFFGSVIYILTVVQKP